MSNEQMSAGTAKPYRGPSGIARESNWLTFEDLPEGRDVVVEIEEVLERRGVVFQGGRKKPIVLALKFKGKDRELGLNSTNRKRLNKLFGYMTGNWVGKRITLYVDPHVQMAGEEVSAVRIRPTEPVREPAGAGGRAPGSD